VYLYLGYLCIWIDRQSYIFYYFVMCVSVWNVSGGCVSGWRPCDERGLNRGTSHPPCNQIMDTSTDTMKKWMRKVADGHVSTSFRSGQWLNVWAVNVPEACEMEITEEDSEQSVHFQPLTRWASLTPRRAPRGEPAWCGPLIPQMKDQWELVLQMSLKWLAIVLCV